MQKTQGPLAHPVRPSRYSEINNFYTATVYEKGAELVRMQETLLGKETFLEGFRRYIERFDGQAVTCEDFLDCMEDASEQDLARFMRWYTHAGTPTVRVHLHHDPENAEVHLTFVQKAPAVAVRDKSPQYATMHPT